MAIKMGKSKQTKEKKFNRSVEISAPILDPEIIKAIHSPPPEHAGFKELLSGINNQDSIDEVTPLDDRHIPSYIGIACAVSGYTSYSSRARQAIERARGNTPVESEEGPESNNNNNNNHDDDAINKQARSRPTSPVLIRPEQHINHITLDRSHIQSPDEERKELTERLTASANEHWRSPSPTIPPTEDDRHHGAYVGARYFPLTPPPQNSSNLASANPKQIPLLGIDDDVDLDKVVDDENNKNEQRIASLYGDDFAKDWGKKEKKMKKLSDSEGTNTNDHKKKMPKDLVKLKPTPKIKKPNNESDERPETLSEEFIKAATAKDKAKNFFSKMFGGRPKSPTSEDIESKNQPNVTKKSNESPKNLHDNLTKLQISKQSEEATSTMLEDPIAIIKEDDVTQSHQNKNLVKSDESNPYQLSLGSSQEKDTESTGATVTTTTTITDGDNKTPNQDDSSRTSEIDTKQIESKHRLEEEHVEVKSDVNALVSHDGRYYLGLLNKERLSLENLVKEADTKLTSDGEASNEEEISGKVRSAIGKANLLITKKFKQFEELCDANINKSPDEQFATLDDDLAGFWDMILIQVDDIKRAFNDLDKQDHQQASIDSLSSNDSATATSTTTNTKSNKPKLSAQKDQERRGRLQEHINQMKAKAAFSEQANDDLIITTTTLVDELNIAPSLDDHAVTDTMDIQQLNASQMETDYGTKELSEVAD